MLQVARINIAPVRSLGLESREEIHLGRDGVAEDRRFYVIDARDVLVDQLTFGGMVQVAAWTNPEATVLKLAFPDGSVVEDEVQLDRSIETPVYGRTAVGHIVVGPWADALSTQIGRAVRIVRCDHIGGTRKGHPASLITDGSLGALGAALGVGDVDARRFRMLIELTGGFAHEEDTWVGGKIGVGETILRITGVVPRCAMTTHDPDTGQRDFDTLRAIKEYRGQHNGKDVIFGVLGDVETPGVIRLRDSVQVLA